MHSGWVKQKHAHGQPTRDASSRGEWLQSLCCRVAAARLAICQQAAVTNCSQARATAASNSGACAVIRRMRASNTSDILEADGPRGTQFVAAASAAQRTAQPGTSCARTNAAAARHTEDQDNVVSTVLLDPTAAAVAHSDTRALKPGNAAAALKMRRLAAAAAKQEATLQASGLKHNSRHAYSTSSAGRQQLQLRRKFKPPQRQTRVHSVEDSQLKPALQQLLQQIQQVQQTPEYAGQAYTQLPGTDDVQLPHHQQGHPQQQQQLTAVAQLTQLIQHVDHPRQLVHILVTGADSLNAVHITAAAEALLRFVRGTEHAHGDEQQIGIYKTKVKVAFKQLCKLLGGQLLDLDPRAVISLLHCFSKMGVADQYFQPQQLWGDLLHISTSMMEDFNHQQLAMLVYAVAQADRWAQAKPSRRWWTLFFECSQYSMSGFAPQGFANVVWAMGKLQRRPGAEWAAALYKATESQLGMFTPQGLANLGSGLGHMNGLGLNGLPRPSQRWMTAYLAAAEQQLDGFSSQGLANLLWALARLGFCPPSDSVKALAAASLAQLQRSSAQDLSLTVYSFALLKARLPESWWHKYWAVSADKLEQASSQALANTFYALGKHRRVPPSFWLLAFLPAMQQALPHCSSQAAANVLWAAGQLNLIQLPSSWLHSVLQQVYRQLHESKPLELSVVLLALKRLQHKPGHKWLDRFYAASLSQLSTFTGPQLCGVLEALSALAPDSPPPATWSAAAAAQVSARLSTMRAPELTSVIWAMSELQIMPSQDLMVRFMAASAENLHLMDGGMLSRTLRTLVRLGQKPNADWLFLLAEESYYHLSGLQPQQLADFAWGFGQLRYSPGPSWLARAVEAAGQQMPGFSASALVKLLQGLAWVKFKPGIEWLGSVGFRVQQLLGQMTAQELLQSAAALERLGLGPGTVVLQQLSAGAFSTPAAAQALASAAVPKAVTASTISQAASPVVAQLTTAAHAAGAEGGTGLRELQQPQSLESGVTGSFGLPLKPIPPAAAIQQTATAGSGVNTAADGSKAVDASQLQQETMANPSTLDTRHYAHQLERVVQRTELEFEGTEAPVLLLPRPQRPQKPWSPSQLPFTASV